VLSITHACGAVGRIGWGWLADRWRSGGAALVANGVISMGCALLVASIQSHWPLPAVAAACALFGFCALGWNGVYIAAIARRAPPGAIGHATGGSLMLTFAGVILIPPAFAAVHDRLQVAYGTAFGLLSLVSAAGIACVAIAWRSRVRAEAPDRAGEGPA
jgi:fucose permease